MAEEREEETWVKEEEAWAEKASQLLPSLAGSLITPEDFFGVSFEYPYLQARPVVVRVDLKLHSCSSVRSTKPSSSCSASSSSSTWRMGGERFCSYCKSGNR